MYTNIYIYNFIYVYSKWSYFLIFSFMDIFLKKKKPYQFSGSMYESNKRLSWFHH